MIIFFRQLSEVIATKTTPNYQTKTYREPIFATVLMLLPPPFIHNNIKMVLMCIIHKACQYIIQQNAQRKITKGSKIK